MLTAFQRKDRRAALKDLVVLGQQQGVRGPRCISIASLCPAARPHCARRQAHGHSQAVVHASLRKYPLDLRKADKIMLHALGIFLAYAHFIDEKCERRIRL